MRILVTAGGTIEDIDPVRGITNYSTGRLGSLIAERFIRAGDEVTYICGENAVRPRPHGLGCADASDADENNADVVVIRSVAQLKERLEAALRGAAYDCVVHSMAVSDYSPCAAATEKISSDAPYMVLVLKRLPKIIDLIKDIQPDALLVGFKLVFDSTEDELLQAAAKLMDRSNADYVLANDLKDVKDTKDTKDGGHKAILLDKSGIVARCPSKIEIAEVIYNTIYDTVKGKAKGKAKAKT